MSTTVDVEARTTPTAPPTAVRVRRALLGRDAAIVALLALVWLVATVSVPDFGSATTVYYLLEDVFPVLLIALPMTLVIITSEIDLSVGSMVGLSTVVVGALYDAGAPFAVAALVALRRRADRGRGERLPRHQGRAARRSP